MSEESNERLRRYYHDKDQTHQSELSALIEAEEMNLFRLLKPEFYIDGNQWCVLYGENIQNGVCGFGDTLRRAICDFNKSFDKPVEPQATELLETE